MIRIIKYCFNKWWRPILFWFMSCLMLGISELWRNHLFGNIASIIFGLGLLTMLVSSIYQFANRNWLIGFVSLGIFGGTIFLFIAYSVAMFWIEEESPDKWADNLKIPANISINIPANLDFERNRPDSLANKTITYTDFQLYGSFQPGLYEYDFWTGKIESGTIYLKAFEITQEYALSKDRLSQSSSVKIYNPTDSIMKFGTSSNFTIYEGDWGKPYAARFEVWFKPDNGGKEQKLFTKNYKIEGWMR